MYIFFLILLLLFILLLLLLLLLLFVLFCFNSSERQLQFSEALGNITNKLIVLNKRNDRNPRRSLINVKCYRMLQKIFNISLDLKIDGEICYLKKGFFIVNIKTYLFNF